MSLRSVAIVNAIFMLAVSPASAQDAGSTDSSPFAQNTSPLFAQTEPKPPLPEHTGWATLVKDTGRDFASFPQRKSTWVLLAAGGAAALAVHPADEYVHDHVTGNQTAERVFALGKVVGSAGFAGGTAVGLWVVGRYVLPPGPDGSRTNKVSHIGFDLMRAMIVSQTLVIGIKQTVRRDRPTGECCAFPSGHAATAFAMSSVLERHFGYRASWPALLGATYVATSRLVDNRHFLSDVVFGAALGEAAGWTVVGRHGREKFAIQPVPVPGGMMVALVTVGD